VRELVVRPLLPEDAAAAGAVLADAFRGTRYLARMQEVLESALRLDDPEFLCLLAEPDGSGRPTGLVLFGTVLGARLTAKVHVVAGPDPPERLSPDWQYEMSGASSVIRLDPF
jgi:hypothetical protein